MRVTGPVGFDLDLTLINSRPPIMAAWQAVSAETGVDIDLTHHYAFKAEDTLGIY